jgi:drug/metabolite transporter (DMT)-like permease
MSLKRYFKKLTDENKGFIFGFIGIIIFSITPTATKIALGANNDELSPEFITFGRSTVAGFLSLVYLLLSKRRIPKLKYLFDFSVIALCITVIFPLSLSLGLIYSTSIHAGVILAFLPLATAIFASFYFKQKASLGFWVCAFIGCILIVIYILIHSHDENKKLELSYSDILFCIAVIVAAIGYNFGAKLTKIMVSADVISWALVIALPVHFSLAIYYFPKTEINIISWLGFLYVAIFSQWIGFFAWYKGLDIGGAVRVSQIQLLMPFFTFAFSIYLLGETLDFLTIVFSIAIILLIYFSRKMVIVKK